MDVFKRTLSAEKEEETNFCKINFSLKLTKIVSPVVYILVTFTYLKC